MSDDVVYSSKTSLFTLKGNIAIEFMDGQVVEGEFATQDAYNVFLTVDSQPIMIPRQQIRFIKGVQGQQIEADTSQYSLQDIAARANTDDISTQPIPEPAIKPTEPEIPALPDYDDDEGDDDGTFVLTDNIEDLLKEVQEEEIIDDDEDDDDGTLIIVQETAPDPDEDDEEFGTVILETSDEMPAVSEDDEDGELDLTVMLGDSPDEEASEDEENVTASLVCIAGPHIGETLPLKQGIISIGRSSDNALVLSNDKEISRHHAIVLHESGKYVVQDQNSLNGTFVNDEQITGPRYLEDGDIVLVGVSTLKYQEG